MSAIVKVPPLQPGDHLSVAEFERRYRAMPDTVKAELIEGVVYMPMPVWEESHGVPHFQVVGWLGLYHAFTPGTRGGDNSTLSLELGENMPQPDAYLRILAEYGGKSRVGPDKFVVGAPDLIAEIAASSASYDLHEKLRAYERNGVREYIVWRTLEQAVDWFTHRRGKFQRLKPAKGGIYKSKVFPGLWLDVQALLKGDMMKVFQVAQDGLASAEHRKFVAKLRRRGPR